MGLPWGEEDQEDLLHHQRRAAAPARQLFSDRRKGFSENPNVFSEKANFLAKFYLSGRGAAGTGNTETNDFDHFDGYNV